MLVIGLTGGISSGKSTVSRRLGEVHKIPVIDADKLARDVVEPGEDAYKKIVQHFKENVPDLLLDNKQLNRAALGQWVFGRPDELKILNGITHPAIRYAMFKIVFWYYVKGYGTCVLDVPLLFEANLDVFCGITVSVVCNEVLQLERLMNRNPTMSLEEAKNRINSQICISERIERSDYVLENNETVDKLYAQVDTIVSFIKPTLARTIIEYFPPFGAVSAVSVVFSKKLIAAWRQKKKA